MNNEMHAFVDDMGQLFAGWGLPRNTGRIWGHLLLRSEPARLDRIAGDLGIAKSGVSVGTRQLVQLGLARGIGERGSRRLLYEALPELEAIFAARNAGAIALQQALRRGARAAPDGAGRERLNDMADMTQELMDLVPTLLGQLREQRESRARRRT